MNKRHISKVVLLFSLSLLPWLGYADSFDVTQNAAISGYNNKNFTGVSAFDCKRFCLEETQFYCKSFDYNKEGRWCDLSDKSQEDIGGLRKDYPGNPYDHYARKDDYLITSNAAISGYNDKHLTNVTPEDCKRACDAEKTFDCASFDYYKDSLKCDLSRVAAIDVGGLKRDYIGNPYNHYAKKNHFTKFKNGAIQGSNRRHLTNVSVSECKRACKTEASFYCLSFDYYKNDNACDLSSDQADTAGGVKTDYNGNPYDHYASNNYYKKTANAAISGYNIKHLSNVSVDECITACEEESHFTCKSFDYYKNEKACDLSDKQSIDVGGLKTDYTNNPYDHYARPSPTYENKISISRKSQLSVEERQKLIRNNLPVWILSSQEFYYPKPFQEYLQHDVKDLDITSSNFSDLIAWDDLRHHTYYGTENTTASDRQDLHSKFMVEVHLQLGGVFRDSKKVIDPTAAPTYAFYMETNTDEIWIRYFLFFGFNDGSLIGIGDHFGDWVHTSVKLKKQNGEWIPAQYYFSQHAGGETLSSIDDKLAFYVPVGPNEIKEVSFEEAKATGKYHVRAFTAKGNHEVYPDVRGGLDKTNFGSHYLLPNTWEWFPNNTTSSAQTYLPYYAWDMSDVKFQPRPSGWPYSAVEYSSRLPLALFGSNEDFAQLWFYNNTVIRDSGQKTSIFEPGFSATVPPLKILDWGNNFDKQSSIKN